MAGAHLSYSAISMYMECGRRWQGHYKQNLKSPPGEALIFGSTAHKVVEQFIANNKLDLETLWVEEWKKAMASELGKTTVWDETEAEANATGLRLFRSEDVYDILVTIKPKMIQTLPATETEPAVIVPAIEREMHWKLDDMPDILAYIDCIADDGVPVDFKTASRMWDAGKARKEIQPLFYLAALEQAGEHDHNFKFRHVVMTKAKVPKIQVFEEQRSPVELLTMETIVRSVWQGISSGLFIPNPTSWLCDQAYCGAWHVCMGKQ